MIYLFACAILLLYFFGPSDPSPWHFLVALAFLFVCCGVGPK